jgi:5-methylcytosine-specific restriction endonuclease McrA
MEVDHIIEIGSFNGNWNEYLFRHFPAQENLQALCVPCHLKKTKAFNSARTRWKRK